MEGLQSNLYVAAEVMEKLNTIYLNHYGNNGAANLRCCFTIMDKSRASKDTQARFKEYIEDVHQTLKHLSLSDGNSVAYEACDLQVVDLKHAYLKLGPLFGPLLGRITLPLPTKSMLHGLKACLEVDSNIVEEVLFYIRLTKPSLTAL